MTNEKVAKCPFDLQKNVWTPAEARAVLAKRELRGKTKFAKLNAQSGVASNTVSSPASIVELARALKNDVDLIFYHVYNNIEFTPSFGLEKGSLGCLIDGIGNPFDQCQLLVDLLREAGHSAKFEFGEIDLSLEQTSSWLGTDSSGTDTSGTHTLSLLLANGVPCTWYWNDTELRIVISHVWVKVTIGSVDYVLDPSYKSYSVKEKIDLASAMQYDQGDLLAAAQSGATVDTNGVWIQNANYEAIKDKLSEFSMNLVSWIKTNNPTATMDDIVGGRQIVQSFVPVRQTTLPYQNLSESPLSWIDIPDSYRIEVSIFTNQAGGIDEVTFADQLYGKRFTAFFYPDGVNYKPILKLDGSIFAEAASNVPANGTVNYSIGFSHPYSSLDAFINLTTKAPYSGGTEARYYVLGLGFGTTRKAMVDLHRDRYSANFAQGGVELDEDVLGEQLSAIWFNYVAQFHATADILGRMHNRTFTFHHWAAVIARDTHTGLASIDATAPRLIQTSLDSSSSPEAGTTLGMLGHAAEAMSIQQLTNSKDGISSNYFLRSAVASGQKIYKGTSTNWYSDVEPNLTNNSPLSLNSWVVSYLGQGYQTLIPEESGHIIGNFELDYGFSHTDPAGRALGLIGTLTPLKGGLAPWGWGGECTCKTCEEEASDPVGLRTGAFKYRQTDLTVGSSSYPYQLSFETEYSSADRYKDSSLGFGWSHNWMMEVVEVTESFRGLGFNSAVEACASLVSFYASLRLLEDTDLPVSKLLAAWLIGAWWSDQMTLNVVSARTDSGSVEFVKLPDGSFQSTEGDGWSVAEDAGEYTVTSPQKVDYVYNTDGDLETISFPYGVTISLTYSSGKLTAIDNGMGRAFSLSYTGDHLTSVSDGNGRSVGYSYDSNDRLEAITDPLENDTTFSYDAAGLMKSYFMPENPTVPMVVNTYDTLGRVASQLDMYGRVIARVESSNVTVSGTVTVGDVATITARVAGLVNGQKSVSYTVQAGDNLTDIATGLKNAVNADAALSGIGVTASLSGAVISFESLTSATYGLSTSLNATVELEATATAGDVIIITVHDAGLSGGQKSVSYTVVAGDTTNTIAQALKNAINVDSDIINVGVTASDLKGSESGRFALLSNSSNQTNYSSAQSVDAVSSVDFDTHSTFYFAGWRSEFKNALGYNRVFYYDSDGNSIKSVDELGYPTLFSYDIFSRLIDKVMPEGNMTSWIFANSGNVSFKTERPKPQFDTDDIVEAYTWDTQFNSLASVVDGNGNFTENHLDPVTGRVLKIYLPEVEGHVPTVIYRYNGRGQIISRIDQAGNQTLYTYDNSSEVQLSETISANWSAAIEGVASVSDVLTVEITDGDIIGGSKAKDYVIASGDDLEGILRGMADLINGDSELAALGIAAKAFGLELSLTVNPLGGNTIFTAHTSSGSTSSLVLTEGLAITRQFTYSSSGDISSMTDARGNTTFYDWDKKRRLKQFIAASPFEFVTDLVHDKNDNLVNVKRQTGRPEAPWQVYNAAYNIAGQIETLTDPSENSTTKVYTELNEVWKVVDGANDLKEYVYDERRKLKILRTSEGVCLKSQAYSPNGSISTVGDANGNLLEFTRDGFDRPGKTIFPDGTFEQNSSYDANGNVLTRLTRAGHSIEFVFDALDRLIEKAPEGMAVSTFSYDLTGRLLSWSTPPEAGNDASGKWTFKYDSAGRLVSERAPDGKTIGYELDENGNTTKIIYPDLWYVRRAYDTLDRLTDIRLNESANAIVHFDYDQLSRRVKTVFGNGTYTDSTFEDNDDISSIDTAFGSESLAFHYEYNGARRVVSQSVSDSKHLWRPKNANSVVYDPINDLNQYLSVNGEAFDYDENGCLTSDGIWSFVYDTEMQLISSSSEGTTVSYSYDPLRRQIQKDVDNSKTRFVYSGWQRLADYDGNTDALLRRYVYGSNLNGPAVVIDANDTPTFLYYDRLGSVVVTADELGTIGERYSYSPFGRSGNIDDGAVGYAGQRFDSETGLYYFNNRYYSPALGRFLQPDFSEPKHPYLPNQSEFSDHTDGTRSTTDLERSNLYSYVLNDPLNLIDPTGHFAQVIPLIFVPGLGQAILIGGLVVGLGAMAALLGLTIAELINSLMSPDNNGYTNVAHQWVKDLAKKRFPDLDICKALRALRDEFEEASKLCKRNRDQKGSRENSAKANAVKATYKAEGCDGRF